MNTAPTPRIRVIARLRNGTAVKGFIQGLDGMDPESLLDHPQNTLPPEIVISTPDSSGLVTVSLESLKALFFVKSFEGNKDYREIKFFDKSPPIEGLWVRAKFYDGEALEGVVRNSLDYLTQPGFFLKPPDAQANNEVMYVVKSSLIDFRVLGVRTRY
jgi:hypothetical protein